MVSCSRVYRWQVKYVSLNTLNFFLRRVNKLTVDCIVVGSGQWMSWCMFGALIVCFPMLMLFKEQYRRLLVDKGRSLAPSTLQNSIDIRAQINSDTSHDENNSLLIT